MAWSMPTTPMSWNTGMIPAQPVMPDPSMTNYTAEQWAAMQQQNWQQWSQWQQQYANWQQQYGEKYAQSMQSFPTMGAVMPSMPPLPAVNQAAPPAPPPPENPPPPPHENDQPLYGHLANNNVSAQMVTHQAQQNSMMGPTVAQTMPTNWANNVPITDNSNSTHVNAEALNKLAEEERLFNIQFQKWEAEIEQWKKDNVNHPDKQAYSDYEKKFESCRAQLLERKRQMLLRRDKLLGVQSSNSGVVTKPLANTSNQNVAQTATRTPAQNQQLYTRKDSQTSQQNYNEESQNHNTDAQAMYYEENSNTGFLNTNSAGGIPGLDLVPDKPSTQGNPEASEITGEKKKPDYTNISKGINTILGDEKIMNILSMVRTIDQPQTVMGNSNASLNTATYTAPANTTYAAPNNTAYAVQNNTTYATPNNTTYAAVNNATYAAQNTQQNMYNMQNMMQIPNQSYQNYQQYPMVPQQQALPQQQVSYGMNQMQTNYQVNNSGYQGNQVYQANNQNYQDVNQINRQNQFSYNNVPQQVNQNQNMVNRVNNSGLRTQNVPQQQNVQMNYPESKPKRIPPLMQPIEPEIPKVPQWVEEPMFTPSIVVEYEHRPLRDKTREFIDPVHTFDYDHKSKEEEKTKEDIEREIDEELFSKLRDRRSPFHDPYERDRGYNRDPYSREKDPYSRERELQVREKELQARERELYGREREPFGRREPVSKERDPYNRDHEPYSREREPLGRERESFVKDRESFGRERELFGRDREPIGREQPFSREREPLGRARELFGREREPVAREREPVIREREPIVREREPVAREREPVPVAREWEPVPVAREWEPIGRELDPLGRERDLGRDKDLYREPFGRRDNDRGKQYGHDDRVSRRERSRDKDRLNDRSRGQGSRERDSRKRGISIESDGSKSSSKKSKGAQGAVATGFPDKNKHVVMIDDLLEFPGREARPNKIVIILRGPPGSGKSYLAKLIRDREAELGGTARIMSIDDYFVQETEVEENDPITGKIVKKPSLKYEYDEAQEETYFNSLKRAFKRSLTDGYFNFLIMDAVNDQLKSYADIWNFARQNGFQVYICQLELDPEICFKRNIHNRSLTDIQVICARFFPTPNHHIQLDATSLLQNAAIEHVHMEDAVDTEPMIENTQENEVESVLTSKWEKMDDADKLARLDGTSKRLKSSSITMEDYLQLDEWTPHTAKPGKKTVRWADIEERREQEKMRAIGFVVGQTDWNRMTDPTMGSGALTKTKFIERVRRN